MDTIPTPTLSRLTGDVRIPTECRSRFGGVGSRSAYAIVLEGETIGYVWRDYLDRWCAGGFGNEYGSGSLRRGAVAEFMLSYTAENLGPAQYKVLYNGQMLNRPHVFGADGERGALAYVVGRYQPAAADRVVTLEVADGLGYLATVTLFGKTGPVRVSATDERGAEFETEVEALAASFN